MLFFNYFFFLVPTYYFLFIATSYYAQRGNKKKAHFRPGGWGNTHAIKFHHINTIK